METGSWILVPPVHLLLGVNASWWVSPQSVNWTVAKFDLVREVLASAAGRGPLNSPG